MFFFGDDRLATGFEYRFNADKPGTFAGYGSVFNGLDSHDDTVLPGAFAGTLAEHKTRGTMPSMHAMHSLYFGGDMLPIGVWTNVAEDSKGLTVEGRLSGLDTERGKTHYGLMQDGAIRGLSIVFRVPKGGSKMIERDGKDIREIREMKLRGIDLVDQPSQHMAHVTEMRSAWMQSIAAIVRDDEFRAMMKQGDAAAACAAIIKAAELHQLSTGGGNSPTSEQRLLMIQHLNDAHVAASGGSSLPGMKLTPGSIREFEDFLHRVFGYSIADARQIAAGGYKSAFPLPRDEGADRAAIADLRTTLAGFKLT